MYKRGEHNTAFRKRFFGLRNRDLYYFKSRDEPVPLGSIDLRTLSEIREGPLPVPTKKKKKKKEEEDGKQKMESRSGD